MPAPPMFTSGSLLVILYGLAIILGIIVFYVVVSVAVERSPGCLAAFLIIGAIVAYFALRSEPAADGLRRKAAAPG